MARPKKSIRKVKQIKVCYTLLEWRIIQNYAERSGLRVAEFVHDKSLNHKVKSVLTEEEIDIRFQLIGMANNLNQLTRNSHRDPNHLAELPMLIKRVHELLGRFK